MPLEEYDIAVVGGGVVGAAVIDAVSRYDVRSILIERNSDVAEGISKANSGVIHAGFNVPPGTMKARLNVEGLSLIYDLAETLGVPHRKTGKLVVALDDDGLDRLEALRDQGRANGTPGLEIVDARRIRELEPLAAGKWALWSPHTGIVSPYHLTIALAERAFLNGSEISLGCPVTGIDVKGARYEITTPERVVRSRWVINCAGLESDAVAAMAGIRDYRIFPYRGEYLITDKAESLGLTMPIYPVPPKDGPGLGVHITPTTENTILIGPSAHYTGDKNDLATTRNVMDELKREAYELMPQLKGLPFIHSYSGIRPKLVDPEGGEPFRDFVIGESPGHERFVNAVGIESPGLTSAPAIARLIAGIITAKDNPSGKKSTVERLAPIPRFAAMSDEDRLRVSSEDPRWNEMVCRCESVTRAEVEMALDNPLGAVSLDAVKRRTRCGMGRCQGAFCTPRITAILEERGFPAEHLTKNGPGSELFYGKIKETEGAG